MKAIYLQKKGERVVAHFEAEVLNVAFSESDVVAFIELGGALTAVRAMWAHLMRARVASSSDRPDDTNITIQMTDDDGRHIKQAAKERYVASMIGENIVVMRKGFKKEMREYFVGGDLVTPSPYFMSSFRIQYTKIPVIPEWEKSLWDNGIKANLICPMDSWSSNGLSFWSMNSSNRAKDQWMSIVKEACLGSISGSN
jgi:hypothetical protein